MSDFTKSLPTEVWLNIFKRLKGGKQLEQCCLVCRSWRPLVEMVMYKALYLGTANTQLAKVSKYLATRPDLGHLVQKIVIVGKPGAWFTIGQSDTWPEMYRIFRYTPNLKVIDGKWCDVLVNILQRPECLALKLEELPCNECRIKPLDLENMLARFKETLRSLAFTLDRFTPYDYPALGNSLNQLKHLQQLTIGDDHAFTSIRDLDHLQRDDYIHTDKVELEQWLENSVQRVETVKTLTVEFHDDSLEESDRQPRDIGPDWMYYLAYKYPSLTLLEVISKEYNSQHLILPKYTHMDTFDLDRWKFYDIYVLKQFIDRLATQSVYIKCRVDYEIDNNNPCICQMSAVKKAPTEDTTFLIELAYNASMKTNLISVLSLFSSRLIKELEIDLRADNHLERIYASMERSLNVESFKITSYGRLLTECPGQPILAVLRRLEIVDTNIKSDFMTQLSKYAPHLTHLTLDNCTFGGKVLMPNIELASLSLRKTSHTNNAHLKDRSCTELLFAISTNKGPGHIFLASPQKPLQRMTRREAQLLKTPIIYIKCESLRHLSVSLEDIRFEMEFNDTDNLIERVDCGIEDSYYTTLERNMKILMENQEKMENRIKLAEDKFNALQIKDIEDSV